ncbi:MAG: M24 family metallopeptidase [Promethearchaeota archaeon]
MKIPIMEMDRKVSQVRKFMVESDIDAWLIYDFEGSDATGAAILGSLTPHSRQYAIIITQDEPIIIIKSQIESHELIGLVPNLKVINYKTQSEFKQTLSRQGARYGCIAVNCSKNPVTDFLPAGRFVMLRESLPSAKWVSGENLMQIIHSVLTPAQLSSQEHAAKTCTKIMEQAFSFIAERIGKVRECEVADFILSRFAEEKLVTVEEPMVAVQANSANPHYTAGDYVIKKNNLIMIDLWAKWDIFADITWMAYTGSSIPEKIQDIWGTVLQARKNATDSIRPGIPGSIPDEHAREVLIKAGFENNILHRTGHSIDSAVHGKGVNLDSFEMPETRLLLPNLVVSVEPGIYLPNQFGIRSEIDVVVTQKGSKITTKPQKSILCI